MAQYIGKAPINGFHAKQTLTGDGSTTAFTLDQTTASETALIVSVGGVIQEPKVAYNLTIGGTKIDFTEAPSSTDIVTTSGTPPCGGITTCPPQDLGVSRRCRYLPGTGCA